MDERQKGLTSPNIAGTQSGCVTRPFLKLTKDCSSSPVDKSIWPAHIIKQRLLLARDKHSKGQIRGFAWPRKDSGIDHWASSPGVDRYQPLLGEELQH